MARRDEITAFADELLEVASYPDYGPIGLQVAGAEDVSRIACGVSASRELFQRAAERRAQMVIVHHGLFWDRDSRVVDALMRERLRALFDADLSLVAYHLALDAHPEIGNNANLARELGVQRERRFAEVGWGGRLEEPLPIAELEERIAHVVGRAPLVFPCGPDEVRSVAICSGGAARHLGDAVAGKYDCFVTGEAAEPTKHAAEEAGIHFVAAGHYATETSGVQALAARLAQEFGVEWEFVALPNPV
ncbi:MAG: Nif3-like dinuclear metal center hexameric protein [Thermoleophilia bacterium]|nr:Nif3-like dinuclear metal center hexameric protein [Thermoleophilia bacterium]